MGSRKIDYEYNQVELNRIRPLKIMKIMFATLLLMNLTIPVASTGFISAFNLFQWVIIAFHFHGLLNGIGVFQAQRVPFVEIFVTRLLQLGWFFIPFLSSSVYWPGWLILLGVDFVFFLYLLHDKGKFKYGLS